MMSRRAGQGGNVLLEGALTLSVFIMIVFGIIDFGRMVWWYTMLADAAREGSRYASMRGSSVSTPATSSDISTAVKNSIGAGLDPSILTVSTAWSPNNHPTGSVKVTVTYPFTPIVPYIPSNTITLTSASSYTISQ